MGTNVLRILEKFLEKVGSPLLVEQITFSLSEPKS